MRILLTGGTGKVGRAAVQVLVAAGHQVTVIGRTQGISIAGAAYEPCDVNDYDALRRVTQGNEAIVHLAAIPNPVGTPGREIFRVNNLGTFHVFEAAAECGVGRVVGASSINAFGFFFGDHSFPIDYLPIDEDHAGLATDAYSFSKQIMEATGRYFWERDRISGVMLRLPGVYDHGRLTASSTFRQRENPPPVAVKLLEMSEEKREREVRRLCDAYDEHRRTNRLDHAEKGWLRGKWQDAVSHLTWEELHFMSHRANFFTYIDELDSAQAILKGVEAKYEGSHALYVNASRNGARLSLEDAAKLFFPPVGEIRPHPEGEDSLVSIQKARELIGFEPQYMID
jgi:nucleoside-diphosphate-sugar epimerase